MNQLEEVTALEFIPGITGDIHYSTIEGNLLSLPSKLRVLGIPIFADISNQEHEYSLVFSKDLSTKIVNQQILYSSEIDTQKNNEQN